jgi:hypothetical protein
MGLFSSEKKKLVLPFALSSDAQQAFLKVSTQLEQVLTSSLPSGLSWEIQRDESAKKISFKVAGAELEAEFAPQELIIHYQLGFALKLIEQKLVDTLKRKLQEVL